MRAYKTLPDNLIDRLATLTPKKVFNLTAQIHSLENEECLADLGEAAKRFSKTHRITYANFECLVTGKVRSKPLILRSGRFCAINAMKQILTSEDFQKEMKKAEKSGWSEHDISYDSMINGLMVQDIKEGRVNGTECPEILYACDKVIILVHDYHGEQFIGWIFYNSNLDKILHFTHYSL